MRCGEANFTEYRGEILYSPESYNLEARNLTEGNKIMKTKQRYLAALPSLKGSTGFCHRTILVSATDIHDCMSLVRHLRPYDNIGDIKVCKGGL